MVLEWRGSREASRMAVAEAAEAVVVEGTVSEALHEVWGRAEEHVGADAEVAAVACTAVALHVARHRALRARPGRPAVAYLCRVQAPVAVGTPPPLVPAFAECRSLEHRRVHGTLYRRKSVFSARWARGRPRFR